MIRSCSALLLIVALSAVWVQPARAQDNPDERAYSEARLLTLQTQIEADESRLNSTRKEENVSISRVRRLAREIRLREKLVIEYDRRHHELIAERDSLVALVDTLQADLDAIRAEYRARVTSAYKHGRLYDLALILSASSINQMLVRVNYLRRFSEQRKRRLDDIEAATRLLTERQAELVSMVAQAEALIDAASREKARLDATRSDAEQVAQELGRQRSGLEQALDAKRKAAGELQRRIRDMVRVETTRRTTTGSAVDAAAFAEMTGSFRDNRGHLPWPARGTVLEAYGLVVDPVYKTKTPNPGVLIATEPGADVFAVFDGRVSSVEFIPDMGRLVLVEHGKYHSVYGNLSKVYVTPGQVLPAGMLLGRSGTDDDPRGAGVFFAVFEDGRDVDPMGWLRRR